MGTTSNKVNHCAGEVLALVKSFISKDSLNDTSAYSNTMAQRKAELDTQVRIQELENKTQTEREKLAAIRTSFYKISPEKPDKPSKPLRTSSTSPKSPRKQKPSLPSKPF